MQAFGLSHSPRDLSGKDEHRATSDPCSHGDGPSQQWALCSLSPPLGILRSGDRRLFGPPPCQCVALPSNPWPLAPSSMRSSGCFLCPFVPRFCPASSSPPPSPPFFLFDSGWEPPSMQRLSLLTSVSHMLAHKASASLRRLSNALQLPSHPAQYFGLESLMPHGTTLTDFVLNFGPRSTARTYQAISMYERETIDLTLLYQVDIQRPDSGCGGVEIQINDDSA